MDRRWRKRAIPATTLAMLGHCETKLVLQRQIGDKATPAQARAREQGVREHARFHAAAVRHHNQATPRDSRCFIATAVYGGDDPRTHALRAWRDRCLAPTWPGRLLIRSYYRLSPPVARFVMRHPRARAWARARLDGFIAACLPADVTP